MFERSLSATEIIENTTSRDDRLRRSDEMSSKYPNYVPMFVKYYDSDCIFRNIISKEISYMKLLFIFRQKRNISPTLGLMSLIEQERDIETGKINVVQVPTSQTIGQIADKFLHSDGFLYINICCESIFG